MLVLCHHHLRLCKHMKYVMACICNSAMFVAMIMPWPQPARMPMHVTCTKLFCVLTPNSVLHPSSKHGCV